MADLYVNKAAPAEDHCRNVEAGGPQRKEVVKDLSTVFVEVLPDILFELRSIQGVKG